MIRPSDTFLPDRSKISTVCNLASVPYHCTFNLSFTGLGYTLNGISKLISSLFTPACVIDPVGQDPNWSPCFKWSGTSAFLIQMVPPLWHIKSLSLLLPQTIF